MIRRERQRTIDKERGGKTGMKIAVGANQIQKKKVEDKKIVAFTPPPPSPLQEALLHPRESFPMTMLRRLISREATEAPRGLTSKER